MIYKKIDKQKALLIIIIFLGAFLRFYKLGQNPPSLYWDEVAIGLDAYSVAQTGRDINGFHWLQPMFGSYGDFKAPVYIWLTTISVKFFGLNDFAVRLPSAVFGTLLILLVYLFTKELISKTTDYRPVCPAGRLQTTDYLPILSALIIAISPWPLHFSRIGFESHLSVFWLILSLFLFLRGLKKSGWYFLPASLSAILGVYSYFSIRVILPVIFIILGIIYFKNLWRKKWFVSLAVVIFIVLFIPLLKSPFYKLSQQYRLSTKNIISNPSLIEQSSRYLDRHDSSFLSRLSHHRYWFFVRDFAKNYFSHFSPKFLFFTGDKNLRHHSGFGGEFLLVFLPFFFVGLYLMLVNMKQKSIQLLWTFLLASPVVASIPYEVPHASRAIYLFVPLSIVIAWGIIYVVNNVKFKGFLLGFLLLGFLVNYLLYFHDYLVHYPKRSSRDWIYPYKEVAKYLEENYIRYSSIEISPVFWMPDLYLAYEMPELLDKIRTEKKAQLKDSATNFRFPEVIDLLVAEPRESSGKRLAVEFLYPEFGRELSDYIILKTFYFLDGEKSLVLVIEK